MVYLRTFSILVIVLSLTACGESPTTSRDEPRQAAFDGVDPPADTTGRGVFAGGGH